MSQLPKSLAKLAILAFAFLGVIGFTFKSYPMMRPGFDIWWHLGMVDTPYLANPEAFPTSRILWHHFWHLTLDFFEIIDLFERALFIHRVQLMTTIALITLAAYLSIRSILHRLSIPKIDLLLSALLAALAWFLMTGTASTAREGGPNAFFVQSWSVWYSLNYQISLPFYFAGTACMLYAKVVAETRIRQIVVVTAGAVLIALCTLAHSAETAYFFVCMVLFALVFVRGKSALRLVAMSLPIMIFIVWASVQQAYMKPEIIELILSRDWANLTDKIEYFGLLLTNEKLNRIDTGWTALHSLSLLILILIGLAPKFTPYKIDSLTQIDRRALIFVAATAIMPLALFFSFCAGLLAMITHLYIAWRFSLASFMFVGISLPALLYVHHSGIQSGLLRQTVILLITMTLILTGVAVSYKMERFQPSYRYLVSLKGSLNEQKSYFRLSPEQTKELSELAESLRKRNDPALLCTDIFTAYYLFFLERYHHVALPQALEYLPGYEADKNGCSFTRSDTSIQGLEEPMQH